MLPFRQRDRQNILDVVQLCAGRKLMGVTAKNLTSDSEELMIQTDLPTDCNMLFEQTQSRNSRRRNGNGRLLVLSKIAGLPLPLSKILRICSVVFDHFPHSVH